MQIDPHTRARPVFFSLHRIRFPVTAVVSITHRVSGILVALAVPGLVYLFQLSVQSPQGFQSASALLQHGFMRGVAALTICVFAHHVFAGLRHLLFDAHLGTRYVLARLSAWAVFVADAVIVLLVFERLT